MTTTRDLQKPVSSQFGQDINDPNFDRKLDAITAGAPPHVREHLLTRISPENCQTIVNYILAMQPEVGPSESYRIGTIHTLKHFAVSQAQDLPRDTKAGHCRLFRFFQEA